MKLLQETRVLDSEIDSLGHMNVRHYLERMGAGNHKLLQQLGLDLTQVEGSGCFVRLADTYTRYRREQFAGANLHTMGGVLEVNEQGMRSYIELRNPDTEDVAACFVTTNQLIERSSQEARPLPRMNMDRADELSVEIPRYGAPRSLTLTPPDSSITAEELATLIPDTDEEATMIGRRTIRIEEDEVDAHGWLREDLDIMFLPFMREMKKTGRPPGPPVFNTRSGKRIGQAMMETRMLRYAQPRLGDEVDYYGAYVGLTDKSRQTRRWGFNRATGQLLSINDSVGVLIDLDARRAMTMPEDMRESLQTHYLPQLAN